MDGKDPFYYHLLNTELCEVFYSSLSYLEIILRNKIDNVFSNYFGPDWIYQYEKEFENNIKISKRYIQDKDKNKLISELNFAFWTGLFSKKYRHIWTDTLLQNIFENKKGKINLAKIAYELNLIRNYRNKIFHYGCILFVNKDFLNPNKMHALIHTYIRYMAGQNILKHLNKIDKFYAKACELKNKKILGLQL